MIKELDGIRTVAACICLRSMWPRQQARAVVQQRHSQLQCGNTVNLKLFLLQGILAPSLHYGCELWGMHTPCGEAQKARVALQSVYDRYLRHICGVKYATPSAMLLEELGLSPLQVF